MSVEIAKMPHQVRIRKAQLYEIHFGRGDAVFTEPFAMRIGELREMTLLTRLSMGVARTDTRVTVNMKQISYVLRKSQNVIQSDDIESDEDGNEVQVWDLAPWAVANKFQFHQTNHRHLDPECDCGVKVWDTDDDGTPDVWQVWI